MGRKPQRPGLDLHAQGVPCDGHTDKYGVVRCRRGERFIAQNCNSDALMSSCSLKRFAASRSLSAAARWSASWVAKAASRLALRGTDRVIEVDPDVVQTALSAPSLQFARLEQSLALDSGISIRTVTVQQRANPRTNDPVVEDFGRLWRTARNFNLRQPPTRISVAPKALAAALAAAHHRDTRLVRHIAERVTVGDQRGHRDPRCLRVAISPKFPLVW